MVILGLLLIILAVAAILAGVFLNDGTAELLGVAMSSMAIFLVGVVAGAVLLWGVSLVKWGTKRSMADAGRTRSSADSPRSSTGWRPTAVTTATPPRAPAADGRGAPRRAAS